MLPNNYTKEQMERVLKMYGDLMSAIQEAGGSVSGFKYDELKEMSAADLVVILGLNGIGVKDENK